MAMNSPPARIVLFWFAFSFFIRIVSTFLSPSTLVIVLFHSTLIFGLEKVLSWSILLALNVLLLWTSEIDVANLER